MIMIGLAAVLLGCGSMGNKATIPEISRTAAVHDVHVSLTELTPTDLRVNIGDEVRFINDRSNTVRIILIEAGKGIACNKGFNGTLDQEADVKPGQYASFCFNRTGIVKYMARELAAVTGGEQVLSAEIRVEGSLVQPVGLRESYPATGRSESKLKSSPER
jgi:plastocyanin